MSGVITPDALIASSRAFRSQVVPRFAQFPAHKLEEAAAKLAAAFYPAWSQASEELAPGLRVEQAGTYGRAIRIAGLNGKGVVREIPAAVEEDLARKHLKPTDIAAYEKLKPESRKFVEELAQLAFDSKSLERHFAGLLIDAANNLGKEHVLEYSSLAHLPIRVHLQINSQADGNYKIALVKHELERKPELIEPGSAEVLPNTILRTVSGTLEIPAAELQAIKDTMAPRNQFLNILTTPSLEPVREFYREVIQETSSARTIARI